MQDEITMELLTDIATALQSVAKDYLPVQKFTVFLTTQPHAAVLQIPGSTSEAAEAALYDLASAVKASTDKTLPSLPLQYRVIGGSEAAGIEISAAPDANPVYGHIIKAKAVLHASNALRAQPRLLLQALKGIKS